MSMIGKPRPALTGLEAALGFLLDGVLAVAPHEEPLATALGAVAANGTRIASRLPAVDEAAVDGFAFAARDLVGASSYSPVWLTARPPWVEVGSTMPAGCDCVLDAELVEADGAIAQVMAEAFPGQGMLRAGEDFAEGGLVVEAGRAISAFDLLIARRLGWETLPIRRPSVRIVDVGAQCDATVRLVAETVTAAGAMPARHEMSARDTGSIVSALRSAERGGSIVAALGGAECDLLVLVGGTGAGTTDNTVAALAEAGADVLHGIAISPGRTAAVARLCGTPVIALPGAPDHALGCCLTLLLPVLDHLSGRLPRHATTLPLLRKIASAVGITEIVLLAETEDGWMPLATGAISLDHLRAASAWLAVPADSEGHAAGTSVAGLPFSAIWPSPL